MFKHFLRNQGQKGKWFFILPQTTFAPSIEYIQKVLQGKAGITVTLLGCSNLKSCFSLREG